MVRGEGTTAVFPIVLDETRADLSNVQGLLAKKQAGALTQSIQKDIENNLEDMIAALQKEMRRRKKQPGGGGGGGGGGKAPLVPPVAELKMLRTLQKQVNGRTIRLDGQVQARAVSETESQVQHRILGDRQGRLAEMTKTLGQKLQRRQGPPERRVEAQ